MIEILIEVLSYGRSSKFMDECGGSL